MDKLDGLTMNLESANREKLRAVFPECFTEERLDIDKLLSQTNLRSMSLSGRVKANACVWRRSAAPPPSARFRRTV